MRTRFLAPLITVVLFGLGVVGYLGVRAALHAHHRSVFAAAEKQLHDMRPPAGVVVAGTIKTGDFQFSCAPQPDRRCFQSEASVNTVGPMFDRMLHATSDNCRAWSGALGGCRVTGEIAGRPAYLLVFGQAHVTRRGHVPAGAIGEFHNKLYVQGSNMMLGLVNP